MSPHFLSIDPEIVSDESRIRPAASEVQVLLSDPARALEQLGWSPTVSLEDGLRQTAEFLATQPRMLEDEEYRR